MDNRAEDNTGGFITPWNISQNRYNNWLQGLHHASHMWKVSKCVCACRGRLVSSMAARGAGWVKRAAAVAEDQAMFRWPPRSPDLTPCDFFFLMGICYGIFLHPAPLDLPETWRRIIAAISEIYRDMLRRI